MKFPLTRFTIAVTGDFGKERSHEKMKQWTEKNGGKFVREIFQVVTHLVCSKEDFRTKAPFVQQAMCIPTIKIVSFDWFEDSLMLGKRIPEDLYLMGPRARYEAQARTSKRKTRKQNIKKGSRSPGLLMAVVDKLITPTVKRFERCCQEFMEVMGCDGYQLYRDHTSFLYDITLVRANLLENKNRAYHLKVRPPPLPSFFSTPIFPMPRPHRIRRARVHIVNVRAQRLQLYESHAVPKSYACFVRYSEPGHTLAEPLAPVGSTFEAAMHVFKMFFGLKTLRPWEDRFISGTVDPDAFMYRPPGAGKAVGVTDRTDKESEDLASLLRQIEQRELGLTRGEYGY